jgi:hypothetical protein
LPPTSRIGIRDRIRKVREAEEEEEEEYEGKGKGKREGQ